MPKAILDKLPDKARDIYEAAWESAMEEHGDEERAAKIAISAVKRAGYSKDEDTGRWHKMRFAEMHITKASLGGDGVMRWAATTSKFDVDEQADEVTPEFYQHAIVQVESGKRPSPVLCVSHIDKGKPADDWVAGDANELYIDGDQPKAKGTFRDTPLGKASFEAVRSDYGTPDDDKIRISLGFYDEGSEARQTDKADGSVATGRRYLKGWIKHLALTRVPVVKETEISVMEAKAMVKTKREDAASIVGAELAEELVRSDKAELDEGLVLKGQEEGDAAPVEPVEPQSAEVPPSVEGQAGIEPAEKAGTEAGGGEPEPKKTEKSVSLDDFRNRVSSAWRARFDTAQVSVEGSWVDEVMDDAVIARENGNYYRVPYSVDSETGEIQFGTPVQVQRMTQFIPVSVSAGQDVSVPHVATKSFVTKQGRRNQIKDLLRQLADVLEVEWTVDTEIANAAAAGNKGSNPPRAEALKAETESEEDEPAEKSEAEEGEPAQESEREKALATEPMTEPEAVEVAAFVDDFATRVKATLLADSDRRDKFATLQSYINTFGEGVVMLVKGSTPPSSRDIADVVSEAVQAAVEPLQNQLAGVKAELDDLKGKATVLEQEPVRSAPQPQSLDTRARVMTNQPSPVFGGPTTKARTAKELAWLSTQEGPGY